MNLVLKILPWSLVKSFPTHQASASKIHPATSSLWTENILFITIITLCACVQARKTFEEVSFLLLPCRWSSGLGSTWLFSLNHLSGLEKILLKVPLNSQEEKKISGAKIKWGEQRATAYWVLPGEKQLCSHQFTFNKPQVRAQQQGPQRAELMSSRHDQTTAPRNPSNHGRLN